MTRDASGHTPSVPREDPELFMAIEDLALVARGVVEGSAAGQHRSPYLGASTDFATHRAYQRGDDLRYVNWKLWARQERLFVKQFDARTTTNVYIMVDGSASMGTAHGPGTKWRYAARVAAALAHLALRARDAPALAVLARGSPGIVPPRAGPGQLDAIVHALSTTTPRGAAALANALDGAGEAAARRGVVVVISDFFDGDEALLAALDRLRFQGHDVLAIQVLDPWERALPERGAFRFFDLESRRHLVADTDAIGAAYARAVETWIESFGRACVERGIDFVSCVTTDPLKDLIVGFLARRAEGCTWGG